MSIKHYFICGHTAKGYRYLIQTNTQSLNKLFILKRGSAAGRSEFMRRIGKDLEKLPYDLEYVHCSSNPDYLDAVLVPKLSFGIADAMLPHIIEPAILKAGAEYIDLGWDADVLSARAEEILNLENNIKQCYDYATEAFAKGLKVHDEWEKIYISNMDFTKANQLTEAVIQILLGKYHFNKESCVKHRFFGGSTPNGPVDYVENITENISTRYFIKGRPGSGKSTMLKKILANAESRGIDTEVYHCGFDPDSLDMLLFPEIDLCIFDSTAPHEYYPSRDGDSIIDMYEELINAGTDEQYEAELTDIQRRYRLCTAEGTTQLAAARKYQEELDQFYTEATDSNLVDKKYNELYLKLMELQQMN